MANSSMPITGHIPGVINPYENVQLFHHSKFISHLGVAFIDLKTTEGTGNFTKKTRTILRKVSGQFNYGTLTVIRGPKQSGKTTLIKTLAGRNNQGVDYESQIFINEDIPPRVVYMDKEMKTNILLSLTPEELLDFSYRLRNRTVSSAERNRCVKELITSFNLKEIQDLELSHCTNEEKLRALVAMILATTPEDRPNLIFLDDPLRELDAIGIENTVTLLKRLTRQYKIGITFAVGQILDSDILAIFDKLYVLSKGGLCVYEGSVEHLHLYLREANITLSSKIQTPMERLIKVASKPSQTTLHLANKTAATRMDVLHMAQKYGIPAANGIETKNPKIHIRNIFDLFGRSAIHLYRMYWRTYLTYLALIAVFTGLLTTAFDDDIGAPSACFNRTSNETFGRFSIIGGARDVVDEAFIRNMHDKKIDIIDGQNLIDENVKFLFVITAGLSMFHLITAVESINEEVKVVINEHRNGWVNINSYFVVKNVIDLCVPIVNTLTCTALSYFFTSQVLDPVRFVSYVYAQFVGVICAQSLGFAIGIISVFNNRFTSLIIVASYLVLFVFSGYLIPMDEIAPWLQGFSYTSFMKLSYELTLLSLYGLDRCGPLHYTNSYVMEEFGIGNPKVYMRNSIIILTHFVVYRFLFWAIMVSKVNKKSTIDRPDPILEHDMEGDDFKTK